MFDTGYCRIVWKELRTQWTIWASLVAGAFLLQALFLVFGREFQQEYVQYPLTIAFVLTACYALTSAAILFAGEREEETDEWLRQLPVSTGRLLTGKLTFTLVSVLLFAAIVIGAGAAVKSLAPYATVGYSLEWWERTLAFLFGSIGLVLWAVFYSLLLGRVMVVLLAAVATQLVISAIAGNFLPGRFEYWMLGVGLGVAAADIWLTRNWLSGRSVVRLVEGNRATTGRRTRFWLCRITRAASRTPLNARTTGVLLWRELRGAVPFALGWSLLGLLMVGLFWYLWRGAGFNYVYLLATPVVCGVMTCAGDNWRSTFRFLSDRGLKPTSVWWTKHAVWFLLALGLVLVFGGLDVLIYGNQSSSQNFPSTWGFLAGPCPLRIEQLAGSDSVFTSEMRWRHVGLAVSLLLSLYAVGHLCSLWFRRVVVAMSIAGITGLLLLAWHLFLAAADISFVVALWPLTLLLIVASCATVSGWLDEITGWRVKLKRAAWIALPTVGVMLAAMVYRAEQIPAVALAYDYEGVRGQLQRTDGRWSSRWEVALQNVRQNFSPYLSQFAIDQQRWFEEDLGLSDPEEKPADTENEEADPDEGEAGFSGLLREFEQALGLTEAIGEAAQAEPPAREPEGTEMDPFGEQFYAEMGAAQGDLDGEMAAPGMGMNAEGGEADAMAGMEMGMGGMYGTGEVYDPWQDLFEDGPTTTTFEQLLSLAEEIDADGTSNRRIGVSVWENSSDVVGLRLMTIGPIIAAAAHLQQEQGDLDAAWQTLRAGRKLTAYLQTQVLTVADLGGVWSAQQTIDQAIHAWAAAEDQTVERLQSALEDLTQFHFNVSNFRERRYAWLRQKIEEYDGTGDLPESRLAGIPAWAMWPTERDRVIRLMNVIEAGYSPQANPPRGFQQYNWPWVSKQITPEHIERWVATTPLLPVEYNWDSRYDLRPVITASAATGLVLKLQIHRIEHGTFPEHLHDLAGEVPRDPLSGGDFGYAPQGFDAPAMVAPNAPYHGYREPLDREFVLPRKTPLLWSPGSARAESQRDGKLIQLYQGYYADLSRNAAMDQAIKQAEQQFSGRYPEEPPPPRRLLYIHVGQRPW